jgi:metal-sulfur cluster biosynthetic enzyme
MNTRARVLDALSRVHDPELDEPITALGFVTSCAVSPDGDVEVLLRLPTPQCAPNFAYLMAADAQNVLRRLPDVGRIAVRLEDHYTGDEINAAIARGAGFTGAFPGETDDDQLEALRELFERKALVARQARLCEALLADGATPEQVTALRLADLPDVPDTRRCVELRGRLGISRDDESPGFVAANGEPVTADRLPQWLRMARLVRASLEVNGGICRSLLQFRRQRAAELEEVGT